MLFKNILAIKSDYIIYKCLSFWLKVSHVAAQTHDFNEK